MASNGPLALTALMMEALVGYPDALDRRAPHPVRGLGFLISSLEARWNDPGRSPETRRWRGVFAALAVTGGAVVAGSAAKRVFRGRAWPLAALLATTGLAQRSLYEHVAAVLDPLEAGDLPAARKAVSRIVGRDVEGLDAEKIAAAAIETLAESFCDGVVAPAFWLLAGGLPGLFAYKAANTADSLVGHREARWRDYGWASARLDDVMNLAPAPLSAGLIALAGGKGWRIVLRDAQKHASPNAGWPEAAMAGALGVVLGGGASYDGVSYARPVLGEGEAPTVQDLRRALQLYRKACALLWLLAGGLAWRG